MFFLAVLSMSYLLGELEEKTSKSLQGYTSPYSTWHIVSRGSHAYIHYPYGQIVRGTVKLLPRDCLLYLGGLVPYLCCSTQAEAHMSSCPVPGSG